MLGINCYQTKHQQVTQSKKSLSLSIVKKISITEPDQVWCSEITYIRLTLGFVYLKALMDWASRYVLSCEVSMPMIDDFCVNVLKSPLGKHKTPEIFNTDEGEQNTKSFTGAIKDHGALL